MIHYPHKGFALLISVVLAAVALSIGLALLDIALKQVILASAAKQSQKAFYAADSVMECALYYDQQLNAFDRTNNISAITCNTLPVTNYLSPAPSGSDPRVTTFTVPCAGSGEQGSVTVYKNSDASTQIYALGYNTCDTNNTRRIERGLKVTY
ncbi:MAG TPA: pilus assembly PilX N-terminal domain-containing protein [Candidatus Paceibacterota bacterium]|nr:pilus assembly PilX N-terminal domain-containing protein [Candidatus Paceibacterota bacterium]